MTRKATSESEVQDVINGSKPAVLMFTAAWCGPCKAVKPIFEALPETYPEVIFMMVDVDEFKEVAMEFEIRAMPTFQAYCKGEKLGEVVGISKDGLMELINKANSKSVYSRPGHKLGGGATGDAAAANAPVDDIGARRAAMASAAEARMKSIVEHNQQPPQ